MTTATAQTKTYEVCLQSQDWEVLEDTFHGEPIWGKDCIDRVLQVTTDNLDDWFKNYCEKDNTIHSEIGKVKWSISQAYEIDPNYVCNEF
jgi:hypothetical protein